MTEEKNKKTRIEIDSLGRTEVPAEALWGAHTGRAIANFPISGRTAHPDLIRTYLLLKMAAAEAATSCDSLPAPLKDLITGAVTELLSKTGEWREIFPVDLYQAGAGTSLHMNINEVIANVANRRAGSPLGTYRPVHPNDHVNFAQSTNDTFPTAMRLALLAASGPLVRALLELAQSFRAKGMSWRTLGKSARTHLQDAVPIRLGAEFTAYASALDRCGRWLERARDELRELGIGGSAAGTGLNVPRDYIPNILSQLSILTGEALRPSPDLYEAMQSQALISHYSSILRVTALELTRICNDLRLLASGPMTGLAELILPAVQAGSSIMPGKINPSIPEMVNQTCFAVLGHDHTVAMAVQAGQLELNVMMPVMASALLDATQIATHATEILRTRCIEGIVPNEKRLQFYLESTPQIATALSPKLGYLVTAELVHEALERGISILSLVREQNLLTETEIQALVPLDVLLGK